MSILLITLIMIGYPLVGILSAYLGVESRTLSQPYRILVFGLSTFLILSSLFAKQRGRVDIWLFGFLFLYLARLVYDIRFNNIPGNDFALQFYLIAVIAPALACAWGSFTAASETPIAKFIVIIGIAITALSLLGDVLGLSFNPWADQGVLEARLGFEALNPISLGHAGVITALSSIYILSKPETANRWRVIAMVALLLGLAVTVRAGSRGALIALVLCTFWFGISKPRRFLWLGPAYAAALIFGATQTEVIKHTLDTIFGGGWAFDGSSLVRLDIQASAINDFLASPLLGMHFANPLWDEGMHPHNLLIETAMAMGVIGLTLFAIMLARVALRMFGPFNRDHPLLAMLLIEQAVNAALSSALWGADAFSALSAIALSSGVAVRFGATSAPGQARMA